MTPAQQRLQKARLQTRREYVFWQLMIVTPTAQRTRAQRRHVQNRQKRGRLVALEVLTRKSGAVA